MKKNFKLVLALVLSLMMVLGSVAALAANERPNGAPATGKSITLTNPSAGHTYELYQIFTGTFAVIDSDDTLGNIAYGNGIALTNGKYDNKTAEELAETIVNSEAGARAFANTVNGSLQNGVSKTAESENPSSLVWDNLSEGYYIIKDVTTNLADGDEHDLVVVQVLDNVSIAAKAGTVTFDKQVADHNDSTQAPTVYDAYGKVSDYDVNDDVPFKVTITLPANFSSYETYSMTVKDKMDEGLVFNNDIAVYVGSSETPISATGTEAVDDGKGGTTEQAVTYYEVKTSDIGTGEDFNVVFPNVKKIAGAGDNVTFTVTYTAKLSGSNIKYGKPGNQNEAWLTYSNNPTTGQEGGTTPHKTTLTFVYKFEVDKVDPDGYPLDGATFQLYKYEKTAADAGDWALKTLVEAQSGTEFTIDGIDAGWYKLVETAAPAGYNNIDPIYFVVEHTYSADGTDITGLSATKTDSTGTKLTGTDANLSANLVHVEAVEDDPATTDKDESVEEIAAGLVSTDVENNKGAQLPSTGGIGTTLFYVGGSILVLLAVVLLVTKKRMGAND